MCLIIKLTFIYIEMNTFIQQECIKLVKSDSEDIYNGQINAVLLNFLFIKESWKIKCNKNIVQHDCFQHW